MLSYLILTAFDNDPVNVCVTRLALRLNDFGKLEALHRRAVQLLGGRRDAAVSFPFSEAVWLGEGADDVFPDGDRLFYGSDDELVSSGETVAAAVKRLAIDDALLAEPRLEVRGAPRYGFKLVVDYGDTHIRVDTSVQGIEKLRDAANLACAVEAARFTAAARNLPPGMHFNLIFYADENDRVFMLTAATDAAATDAAIRLVKQYYVPPTPDLARLLNAMKTLDDIAALEAESGGEFHLRVLDIRPGVPVVI